MGIQEQDGWAGDRVTRSKAVKGRDVREAVFPRKGRQAWHRHVPLARKAIMGDKRAGLLTGHLLTPLTTSHWVPSYGLCETPLYNHTASGQSFVHCYSPVYTAFVSWSLPTPMNQMKTILTDERPWASRTLKRPGSTPWACWRWYGSLCSFHPRGALVGNGQLGNNLSSSVTSQVSPSLHCWLLTAPGGGEEEVRSTLWITDSTGWWVPVGAKRHSASLRSPGGLRKGSVCPRSAPGALQWGYCLSVAGDLRATDCYRTISRNSSHSLSASALFDIRSFEKKRNELWITFSEK